MSCEKTLKITINGESYEIEDPNQSGRELKKLAGIELADTLFLNVPGCDDAVVHNDVEIHLKPEACLYSCPPAKYGEARQDSMYVEHDGAVEVVDQPNRWRFVILHDFALPDAYAPALVKVLLKLPPGFPDAAPDMFWIDPYVKLRANGQAPKATSTESILGRPWQRYSWHLEPGGWRPGRSSIDDFLNCIRARFAHRN